jgi:ferredoxin
MAYVVCEPCHDCKYTDCVAVCPCECFYQDDHMLYIDPLQCIDCDACAPECPVEAIFPEGSAPQKWASYIQLNAERSAALMEIGHITEKQAPKQGQECVSRKT